MIVTRLACAIAITAFVASPAHARGGGGHFSNGFGIVSTHAGTGRGTPHHAPQGNSRISIGLIGWSDPQPTDGLKILHDLDKVGDRLWEENKARRQRGE